jgi:hypothetical protein
MNDSECSGIDDFLCCSIRASASFPKKGSEPAQKR